MIVKACVCVFTGHLDFQKREKYLDAVLRCSVWSVLAGLLPPTSSVSSLASLHS